MAVMVIIIIIDLLAVIAVLYLGSQHDAHHSIRDSSSSHAVQVLQERQAKIAALTAPSGAGESAGGEGESTGAAAKVASALGSDEEKERRRAEALARKAARQSGG